MADVIKCQQVPIDLGRQGCGVAQTNAGEFKYKSQRASTRRTLATLI